jgi:hypothetical protein
MPTTPRFPAPGSAAHAAAEDRLNDVLGDVLLRLGADAPPIPDDAPVLAATGTSDPAP